jgi:hypothetical protein
MSNGLQYGNVGWSKLLMTGFSTALQSMGVQPGDTVLFAFDIAAREVNVSFAIA